MAFVNQKRKVSERTESCTRETHAVERNGFRTNINNALQPSPVGGAEDLPFTYRIPKPPASIQGDLLLLIFICEEPAITFNARKKICVLNKAAKVYIRAWSKLRDIVADYFF